MKQRKYRIISLLIILMLVLGLASCSGGNNSGGNSSGNSGSENNTEEGASGGETEEADDGTLRVSLGAEPTTLDPALNTSVDGATIILHLFSGLAKWTLDDKGNYKIVPDLAEELTEGQKNDDGTITYTYKIREGAKWSDGSDITPEDFIYAWNRACDNSNGGGFFYMFSSVAGYSERNQESRLDLNADEEGNLVVVLAEECPYWNELLAFPAFFPIKQDIAENSRWAETPSTIVTSGPYKLSAWNHNSDIVLEKNTAYYGADSVKTDKIEMYLTDNVNEMLEKYQNGTCRFIDDVPTGSLNSLREEYPEEFVVKGQIGTYSLTWNINVDLVGEDFDGNDQERAEANSEIRNAINQIIDRSYIATEIGQACQVPASSFVAMGITEPDGTEFYQNANKSSGNSYFGYFDPSEDAQEQNIENALETLKKYYEYDEEAKSFTNIPEIEYLFNTSDGHRAIAEAIQYQLSNVGITISIKNLDWDEFLEARKEGNFTIARYGWIADYNDPIGFLDLWTSASGNNDAEFGRGDFMDLDVYSMDLSDLSLGGDADSEGDEDEESDSEDASEDEDEESSPDNGGPKVENGTWADTYDVMIDLARTEKDPKTRYEIMHRAEDLLMSTGCVCPIYFYTDVFMIDDSLEGFYSNPLGYKYFMNAEIVEKTKEETGE